MHPPEAADSRELGHCGATHDGSPFLAAALGQIGAQLYSVVNLVPAVRDITTVFGLPKTTKDYQGSAKHSRA